MKYVIDQIREKILIHRK